MSLNIFGVIGLTTRRVEPFHSMFLVEALKHSLNGDRGLFDRFWSSATADVWAVPSSPTVVAEDVIGRMRVDVVIRDESSRTCLGIEVKTEDGSAREGQLADYQEGLSAKYPDHEVHMAYLTPLNRSRASEEARLLHSVAEFDSFAETHPEAVHMSWLDVADIEWAGGGEIWNSHQQYLRDVVCRRRTNERRGLDKFFGADAVDEFWEAIATSGAPGVAGDIQLETITNTSAFIDAFRVLIEGTASRKDKARADRFNADLRARFLVSDFRGIHSNLFDLAVEYPWVWIEGDRNYGIRVAHPDVPRGVSVCTSRSESLLRIGQER